MFVSPSAKCQKRPGPPKNIIIHWWISRLAIFFTTLELISWDFCQFPIETDISLSLEIHLQNDMKQYHYQIKQLSQLQIL